MTAFVLRRLIRLAVVCVGVSLVTFAILHASGDPVSLIMPEAPEADRAVLRQALGLHDPLIVQFARFVGRAAVGDFGNSFFHRAPAFGLVMERMPTTLTLTLLSMALAIVVALPVGIYGAVRRGRAVDQVATGAVFLGQSMPVFWTGIMLILLFSVQWRWLPVSGWESWPSVVLPTLTLGAFTAPLLLRIVRSSMLEVIGLDYVRTARAKGVAEWLVIGRHAGLAQVRAHPGRPPRHAHSPDRRRRRRGGGLGGAARSGPAEPPAPLHPAGVGAGGQRHLSARNRPGRPRHPEPNHPRRAHLAAGRRPGGRGQRAGRRDARPGERLRGRPAGHGDHDGGGHHLVVPAAAARAGVRRRARPQPGDDRAGARLHRLGALRARRARRGPRPAAERLHRGRPRDRRRLRAHPAAPRAAEHVLVDRRAVHAAGGA